MLEGFNNELFLEEARENYDFHLRTFFTDSAQNLKSIHPGHPDVKQHNIRLEGLRHTQRLEAICRFANDIDVRLPRQEHAEPFTEEGVVVGDEHPDLVHKSLLKGFFPDACVTM